MFQLPCMLQVCSLSLHKVWVGCIWSKLLYNVRGKGSKVYTLTCCLICIWVFPLCAAALVHCFDSYFVLMAVSTAAMHTSVENMVGVRAVKRQGTAYTSADECANRACGIQIANCLFTNAFKQHASRECMLMQELQGQMWTCNHMPSQQNPCLWGTQTTSICAGRSLTRLGSWTGL